MSKKTIGDLLITVACGLGTFFIITSILTTNHKLHERNDEMKAQNVELIKTNSRLGALNDRQKDIIMDYQEQTGVKVTTITDHLDGVTDETKAIEQIKEILKGMK